MPPQANAPAGDPESAGARATPPRSLLGRIAGNTLNYGIGNFLPQVIGFLLIPLYTKFLSPHDYGILDLAASVGAFLIILMRLGVPGAVTRFYFDYSEGPVLRDYVSTIAWFQLVSSAVVGVLALLAGPALIERLIPGLTLFPYLLLVVLTSFFQGNSDLQRRMIQSREQSAYSARLSVVMSLTSIAIALLFVVGLRGGATGMLVSQLVATVIFFAQAVHYLRADLRGSFRAPMLKGSLSYAMGVLPSHFLWTFAPLTTRTILAHVGSVADVGLLSIAARLAAPLMILVNAFATAFHPIYFSLRKDGTPESMHRFAKATSNLWTLACALTLAVALLGPPTLRLALPPQFQAAAPLVPVLALGCLSQFLYLIFGSEIWYSKKTWWVPVASAISLVANTGVTLLLVRTAGTFAVAWAQVAGWIAPAVLVALLSQRTVHVPFAWAALSKTTAIAALLGVVGWMVRPTSPWLHALAGTALLVTFVGLLWVTRDPAFAAALQQLRLRLRPATADAGSDQN